LGFQARNLVELLQMISGLVPEGQEITVNVITRSDPENAAEQAENLDKVARSIVGSRIAFS
jgi:hypothetical protein